MRIAIVHAVSVAMAPVHEAFARLWPEAECTDLLDTALSIDRERDGELTMAMTRRIGVLAEYAAGTGAAGILFIYVVSRDADRVNLYRFDANAWDASLMPAEAARRAGRPAGFVLHPAR